MQKFMTICPLSLSQASRRIEGVKPVALALVAARARRAGPCSKLPNTLRT